MTFIVWLSNFNHYEWNTNRPIKYGAIYMPLSWCMTFMDWPFTGWRLTSWIHNIIPRILNLFWTTADMAAIIEKLRCWWTAQPLCRDGSNSRDSWLKTGSRTSTTITAAPAKEPLVEPFHILPLRTTWHGVDTGTCSRGDHHLARLTTSDDSLQFLDETTKNVALIIVCNILYLYLNNYINYNFIIKCRDDAHSCDQNSWSNVNDPTHACFQIPPSVWTFRKQWYTV